MLYREPIRLVARFRHPIHHVKAPTLQHLADFPWVLPIEQTELRSGLEEFFVHEGRPLPVNRVECT